MRTACEFLMRLAVAVPLVLLALAGCIKVEGPEATDITADPRAVGADFVWTPMSPRVGDSVEFIALVDAVALQADHRVAWAVDGVPSTESQPQFKHVFTAPGAHQVALTVAGHATISHVIAVLARGASTMSASPEILPSGTEPPAIAIVEHELGHSFSWSWDLVAEQVAWDFGDGNVSFQAEAHHLYAEAGAYRVGLTVQSGATIAQAYGVIQVSTPAPRFLVSAVAPDAGEPTVGVTSSGCIFFQASQDVMRSCDNGGSWVLVEDLLSSPNTRDPFLWVDPHTNRIFSAHLEPNGECIWMAWSDDDGDSWLGNPADCGPVPFADHQKLVTGPRVGPLAALGTPLYERAVYLCVNKVAVAVGLGVGIHCYVSFDGGATFPYASAVRSGSGLHGGIKVGPDGSLYVPARTSPVMVYISRDGAVSWEPHEVSGSQGVQDPTNDPDIAIDDDGVAFVTWTGADDQLRLARSKDGGRNWESPWTVAPDLGAVAFPVVQSGQGRLALAFLGTNDFRGNPQDAPPEARWDLYVAWSLDSGSDRPRFVVQQVTVDPVQVGPICMQGNCPDGSRNLLDFIGSTLDNDGRLLVSFADGCVDACATNPTVDSSRSKWGMLAISSDGPTLS